jgi:hypothetical protein
VVAEWFAGPLSDLQGSLLGSANDILVQVNANIVFRATDKKSRNIKSEY